MSLNCLLSKASYPSQHSKWHLCGSYPHGNPQSPGLDSITVEFIRPNQVSARISQHKVKNLESEGLLWHRFSLWELIRLSAEISQDTRSRFSKIEDSSNIGFSLRGRTVGEHPELSRCLTWEPISNKDSYKIGLSKWQLWSQSAELKLNLSHPPSNK